MHSHAHSHGHHHSGAANRQRVFWAMLLTAGFMAAEVVGGLLSGSLALLADAGHMLTDSLALFLAWLGFRISEKDADPRRSFGYHRFQVLAAFVNGLTLVAIVIWIGIEAVQRFLEPGPILAGPMLAIAVLGLVVNVAAFLILRGADEENLNVRGATLHVLGDMLGSVAAIAAAIVILLTGWTPIDPLLSLLVALLILRAAYDLLRRAGHILLEGTPEGIEPDRIKAALTDAIPGITDIHHVHAWSITNERPMLTLHARLEEGADHDAALAAIRRVALVEFAIEHITVQLERGRCPEDGDGQAADAHA